MGTSIIEQLTAEVADLRRQLEELQRQEASIIRNSTPASAAATGTKGEVRWDTSFIYVCVATNTWKRVAISTW